MKNNERPKKRVYYSEICMRYGFAESLVLSYFGFWCCKNEEESKNFYDGRYWTYNKLTDISNAIYECSVKQVRTAIDKLQQHGLIIKGNYNSSPYDRTMWYSVDWNHMEEVGLSYVRKDIKDTLSAYRNRELSQVESSVIPFAKSGNSICPNGHFVVPERADQYHLNNNCIDNIHTHIDIDRENKEKDSVCVNKENAIQEDYYRAQAREIIDLFPDKDPANNNDFRRSKIESVGIVTQLIVNYGADKVKDAIKVYMQEVKDGNNRFMKSPEKYFKETCELDIADIESGKKYLRQEWHPAGVITGPQ